MAIMLWILTQVLVLVQQVPLLTEPLLLVPMNFIFHDFILSKSLFIIGI